MIDNSQRLDALERTHLLISFSNVASQPRPSCLLRLDLATQGAEWVEVGLGQLLASSAGICTDDKYVYHICIGNSDFSTYLTILDRHALQVVQVLPLPEVVDGHSLVQYGDDLIVASAGTDEILAYPLRGLELGEARIVWSPTDSGTDTHHVNSVAVSDGQLLCSAFGLKEEPLSWSTARNGYVRNLTTDAIILEGLHQPHSVTWHGGQLFFCNSLEGTVNARDAVVAYLYGYARGLTFGPDETMYVATSLARRPPQATSDDAVVFSNANDPGDVHGHCALIQMTVDGANRVEVSMTPYGYEIYDIVVL